MKSPAPAPRPSQGELGLWICTALVVGNMIGSGVFLLPSSLAVYGAISIVGWLMAVAGAMLLALVFARLSRILPATGGPYAYTRNGFGDFAGFLVAWGYWISIWAGNAAIAVAMVGYLGFFWPLLAANPMLAGGVAVATIWALTGVNAAGVRSAGVMQLITTILKLLPLVAIATLGLLYLNADHFRPFNLSGRSDFSAITATAALTLWAFLGLESATIPAGHVKSPERTMPRATLIGTGLAAVVYVLGTVAVMGAIPAADLARSTAPFADAAGRMWGSWAGYAVAAGAAISCFGALNGWILLQGQIPLAAATDRLFPPAFARLSARRTPVVGLVVTSVLATLLVGINYTRGLVPMFTFFVLLATLTTLVPYVFSSMALLVIYLKDPDRRAGRQLLGSGVLAGLAFLFSLWAIAGSGQETVYWGLLLLLAGVPVYVWIQWSVARQTGAERGIPQQLG